MGAHTLTHAHTATKIPNGFRSYIAVGKNKVASGRVVDHKPAAKLHKDHVQIPAPLPRGGKEKKEKAKATSKERDACEGWFQGGSRNQHIETSKRKQHIEQKQTRPTHRL